MATPTQISRPSVGRHISFGAALRKLPLVAGTTVSKRARQGSNQPRVPAILCASLLALGMTLTPAKQVFADEGGVSFWVPGFVGSLAATPQVPGFAFANILYYS